MGKKETICWGCQNFAKCSWSRGVPVENWDATPTKIVNRYNDGTKQTINSYCVHSCPQYLADKPKYKLTTIKDVAGIVGKCEETVFWYLKSNIGRIKLKKMLKEKGYNFYWYRAGRNHTHYYLENIGGANESKD